MILRPPAHSSSAFLPRLLYRRSSQPSPTSTTRDYPQLISSRPFTTTPRTRQNPQPTHYDILGVSPSITPSDLKKRFYVLSKENHPDLRPDDTTRTSKFQQISESYTVLADPEKRRKYDRDVMRMRPSVQNPRDRSYAGSRPATGLSKRRSAFRGPPPSYFGGKASTGSSSQSEFGSQSQSQSSASDSASGTGAYAWGPEPQFQQTTDFNPQPIFRTQTVEDQRRERRSAAAAAAAQAAFEMEGDFWSRFVIVTGMVLAGVMLGSLVVGTFDNRHRGGGMVKGDGTMRRPQEGGGKKKANTAGAGDGG